MSLLSRLMTFSPRDEARHLNGGPSDHRSTASLDVGPSAGGVPSIRVTNTHRPVPEGEAVVIDEHSDPIRVTNTHQPAAG